MRRFDLDGDAKINYEEFQTGMKSGLVTFGNKKLCRPKSGSAVARSRCKIPKTPSKTTERAAKLYSSSSHKSITPRKVSRPQSCSRRGAGKKRYDELDKAFSKKNIGPSSNYYLG